jgi:putative transport protein
VSVGLIRDLLATSAPALLFTVVGVGYFFGNIRIRGFTLGVAAVLFVGLVFGALDSRFVIPEVIYVLGLILFVYTVGLQSGAVFFNLFRRQWLRLTVLAAVASAGSALVTVVAARLFGISAPVASGLFCGGLTNTPALAAAVEALRGSLAGSPLAPDKVRALVDGPTVGYSIAYPFGVVGLIVAMQVATKLGRVDFTAEERRARKSSGFTTEEPGLREIRLTNRQLIGRTFGAAMLTDLTGMVFTRIKRGDAVELVTPDAVLAEGDVLVGVGSETALRKAELLVGPTVGDALDRFSPELGHRDLLVINRQVAGETVAALGARLGHPMVVSRIRRGGGVQITPLPDTTLEVGDQIRVVAHRADLDAVTKLVGDPLKDISEADFLSFSLGLVLGVLVGMIPIPLGGGHVVRLGFAGGPLVVGLVLGRIGRSGPIVWTMPVNASMTLRQLGLLFFLAGVGTLAGGSFVHTLATEGLTLFFVGAAITTVSLALTLVVARRVFHYDAISAYGIVAGIHTQPAALAFANSHTGSESPNISYAAVYPVALIAKIILAQLLVVV